MFQKSLLLMLLTRIVFLVLFCGLFVSTEGLFGRNKKAEEEKKANAAATDSILAGLDTMRETGNETVWYSSR